MNVHITTDGVICDVPSLHTWLPDYFGQLKVNPDLLRNCTGEYVIVRDLLFCNSWDLFLMGVVVVVIVW